MRRAGAADNDHLAAIHAEVDVGKNVIVPEKLVHIAEFNNGIGHDITMLSIPHRNSAL